MHMPAPQVAPKTPAEVLSNFIKAPNFFGDGVNPLALKAFVSYVGKLIQSDGVLTDGDRQYKFSASFILDQAQRHIFQAQQNIDDSTKAEVKETFSTMREAYASQSKPMILSKVYDNSAGFLNTISQTLGHDEFKSQFPESSDLSAEEQKSKLETLICQAELSAIDTDTGKLNPAAFTRELKRLISDKENITGVTSAVLESVVDDIKSFGIEVKAFAAMSEAGGKALDLKDLSSYLGSSGDFSKLSFEKRKEVAEIIEQASSIATKALENGTTDQERVIMKANLLKKLSGLSDEQKAYFSHLVNKHEEVCKADPIDLMGVLTKSLPSLIVPGIMGAMIAAIFGFSSTIGVIGAAAVSLLGRMGGQEADGNTDNPDLIQFYGKKRPALPNYRSERAVSNRAA